MLSFFKKKESDVHERKIGVSTRECDDDYEIEDEDEDEWNSIGVLIQFTPIATYLYVNKEGFNNSDDLNGYFELIDMEGNYLSVFGNLISTSIDNISDLPKLIEKFRLNHTTIPIVEIEVEEYEG